LFDATQQTLERRRRNPANAVFSTAVHLVVGAILWVVAGPGIAEETKKIVDVKFYSPPPPPPPPPPASSSRSSRTRIEKIQVPTEIVQPTEVEPIEDVPQDAPDEEEPIDGGVEGGVEGGDPIHGVLGGVIGGVAGGVVGGVVGGTGSSIADVSEGDVRCVPQDLNGDGVEDVEYPPLAKKQGITGTVVVEVIIGLDGRPESASVKSGPTLFHQAALKAARSRVCEPYRSGNVTSRARLKITYNFTLR